MALLPADFITDVLADITTWLTANIGVIGALLALTTAVGFVLRAIRKSRKSVERTGSRVG